MSTFDELLAGPVLGVAKRLYKAPTEIQKRVIPVILAKKDVVAMSKTGSGKTAAFLLPMIQILGEHSKITGCRGLILSPTRELSLQTANFFRQYSSGTTLKSASLIGGEPLPPQFDALTQNPDVIIATPGRLLHIIAETRYSLSRVQYVVVDEADRMFEDPKLETELSGIWQMLPKERQVLLFSATIPQLMADFSQANLKNAIVERVDRTELPDTLRLRFRYVTPPFKTALMLQTVAGYRSSLVFVGTRHHAEFLSAVATEMGIRSACIYGTMDQDERSSSLAGFARGSVKILFVTDVAARGLDVEGLDLVVNYDFPARPKVFLHRSGRAGRAGRSGEVVSFVTKDELPYFCGAKEALKGDDWFLQKASQQEIQDELTRVDDAIRRSTDLQTLKKGMEDGEKMYVKSRPAAKPMWLGMAKNIDIEADSNTLEDRVLSWRPPKMIFEQVAATAKQSQAAAGIRDSVKGHLKRDAARIQAEEVAKAEEAVGEEDEETPAEEKKQQAPVRMNARQRKALERRKAEAAATAPIVPVDDRDFRTKFFVNPIQEGHDATAIREGVVSLREQVTEMTPEDRAGMLLQKQIKRENKKGRKEKLIKAMTNGHAFVRSAVAQMEGVNPKGDKYRQWVEQSHKHIQDAGQEERIVKTKKGKQGFGKLDKKKSNVKSELKTPEQIEKDRLIKLKHKLNDQGKHREAAKLNAKIYGRKRK